MFLYYEALLEFTSVSKPDLPTPFCLLSTVILSLLGVFS